MQKKLYLGILIGLFLVSGVLAVSDTAVFQGQYFINNEFQQGTYDFDFNIYDAESGGTSCFSDSQTITTGFWGQWRAELTGISASCNDSSKDYFMEIIIGNSTQSPRRRLTHFNYLRKNVDDSTTGDLTISSILNFILGGYLQELTGNFLLSKSLTISGDLNATGSIYSDNKLVCLEDGTNCVASSDTLANLICSNNQIPKYNVSGSVWQCSEDIDTTISDTTIGNCSAEGSCPLITYDSEISSSIDTNCTNEGSCPLITYDSELDYTIDTDTNASTACSGDQVLLGNGSCISSSGFGDGGSCVGYVSFISTVDGKINKNDRYLSLGTDGGISASSTEMSWIIDRDMTITGILWDAKSNSRSKSSAIILMSGSNKNSLSETSLSKDIQGVVKGSDTSFSVSLSQGDAVAIKYDSGGNGGDIEDLSITLIGTYD